MSNQDFLRILKSRLAEAARYTHEQAMLPELASKPRTGPYMHGFDACLGIVTDTIKSMEELDKESNAPKGVLSSFEDGRQDALQQVIDYCWEIGVKKK